MKFFITLMLAFCLCGLPAMAHGGSSGGGGHSSGGSHSSGGYSHSYGGHSSSRGHVYHNPSTGARIPTYHGSTVKPPATYHTQTVYKPSNNNYRGLPTYVQKPQLTAPKTTIINGRQYTYHPNAPPKIYSPDRRYVLSNGPRRVVYRTYSQVWSPVWMPYYNPFPLYGLWNYVLFASLFNHVSAQPTIVYVTPPPITQTPAPQATDARVHTCQYYNKDHQLISVQTVDSCPTPYPDVATKVQVKDPEPTPDPSDDDGESDSD
jgi:hypothetical protein